MGDAKSHTRRLKLEDMNVNIYFLLIRWVPASLQRTTAIAPVARGRHDRKSAVSLVIIITWLMGSIQLKPCMVKHNLWLWKNKQNRICKFNVFLQLFILLIHFSVERISKKASLSGKSSKFTWGAKLEALAVYTRGASGRKVGEKVLTQVLLRWLFVP